MAKRKAKQESVTPRRMLVSVSDKEGLATLAPLADADIKGGPWEFISTGGTATTLRKLGLKVIDVSEFTGFPEMFDGRLKTLHPKVHGGILYRRSYPQDKADAATHAIVPIDMIVVNLYPFESTIARSGCTRQEAIEQIDIGGPTMLRSAAKNHESVTVIVDPRDYKGVVQKIQQLGDTTPGMRWFLAGKVFVTTARYDRAIAKYFEQEGSADTLYG